MTEKSKAASYRGCRTGAIAMALTNPPWSKLSPQNLASKIASSPRRRCGNSLVPRLRDDVFFVNEWTRQGDCLTLFLVVIAAGRRSAQRRILAEHGECSLMMRGNGLQRSGLDDRTSTDAVNRVTDIEQGRRIMDAGGSLVHPCSLFNCHRRVASELDRAAE